MNGFCRDCLTDAAPGKTRCATCGSPRLIRHPELETLSIAHVDCDAFYATIEKRDNPEIADKPVAVGGGKRGVVAAACYIARTYGVRSAMPMFKALDACPHLVVVKPNMAKYVAVGREVRKMMRDLTPLVEPLSIDEAFMDLTGTQRLHGMSVAKTLAKFAIEVEKKHGITVSVGLAPNKFLAKVASDIDKPRGFAVLGNHDAAPFLAPKPVGFIYGVGHISAQRLASEGYRTVGDLQRADERELMRRYGEEGLRLARLAKGIDTRKVEPERETKSVSAETTFNEDISAFRPLEKILWDLRRSNLLAVRSPSNSRRRTSKYAHAHGHSAIRRNWRIGFSPLAATCWKTKPTGRNSDCLALASANSVTRWATIYPT